MAPRRHVCFAITLTLLVLVSEFGSIAFTTPTDRTNHYRRQPPSTALSAERRQSIGATFRGTASSLISIIVPAIRSLTAVPARMLWLLLGEISEFLRSHQLWQLYDIQVLQRLSGVIADRVEAYWRTLAAMESECVRRTLCDLADFAATRTPKWAQQIALIYLNTFVESRPMYQIVIAGMTTHRCEQFYPNCDPDRFLQRVQSNMTAAMETTVAPLIDAFDGLLNATRVTMRNVAFTPHAIIADNDADDDDDDRQ